MKQVVLIETMNRKTKTGLIVLCMVVLNINSSAQEATWKQETTKDGKVSVSYTFSESVDHTGKKFNVLEYEAVTTAAVTLENCKAVLTDDPKHMVFMEGTERVRRIKDLPGGEWLTYYFLNSRWPMPDADLVTKYKLEEDPGGKRFTLTGTPAPDMYPEQDVARMDHNHTKYTVSDLGNGQVELVMYCKSIPLVSVPKWLIGTWIPDGPADMLNGIVKLASEMH
jgi:hypothetical protein